MSYSGYLYLLDNSLLFIYNPIFHVQHEDIMEVVFLRMVTKLIILVIGNQSDN